ncbi:hypothetical protein ElyMa_000557800 [Elysia marginata]|uniref:Uncharacterized protein n=1 Tax=Elysia marginata TaxID=1093978 RepID=A0AAV4G2Y5_9GAST|nr:hypothetical protein ElyMa_000557800 [Elysia marginata]
MKASFWWLRKRKTAIVSSYHCRNQKMRHLFYLAVCVGCDRLGKVSCFSLGACLPAISNSVRSAEMSDGLVSADLIRAVGASGVLRLIQSRYLRPGESARHPPTVTIPGPSQDRARPGSEVVPGDGLLSRDTAREKRRCSLCRFWNFTCLA